jgi:hypothetical protein
MGLQTTNIPSHVEPHWAMDPVVDEHSPSSTDEWHVRTREQPHPFQGSFSTNI